LQAIPDITEMVEEFTRRLDRNISLFAVIFFDGSSPSPKPGDLAWKALHDFYEVVVEFAVELLLLLKTSRSGKSVGRDYKPVHHTDRLNRASRTYQRHHQARPGELAQALQGG
jgi:hypothetical protein